ncbi:MAG: DNA recombination protein RmuC, partial [Planctomycetota bacterium]
METYWLAIASAGGLLAGGAIAWFVAKSHTTLVKDRLLTAQNDLASTRVDLEQKNKQISELTQTIARLETTLEHEHKASGEKLSILNDATIKLS